MKPNEGPDDDGAVQRNTLSAVMGNCKGTAPDTHSTKCKSSEQSFQRVRGKEKVNPSSTGLPLASRWVPVSLQRCNLLK